jgi:hypothetical protein
MICKVFERVQYHRGYRKPVVGAQAEHGPSQEGLG